MREKHVTRKFRALLDLMNDVVTRKGRRSQAKRDALEGEAAQIGLPLEEKESKGRPAQGERHSPRAPIERHVRKAGKKHAAKR